MRKLFTLILIMTLSAISLYAQTTDKQKKEINNIKKSDKYIYAEVTTTTEQDAIDFATDLLHQRVNEYVATQKKFAKGGQVITTNTNYAIDQITMPRGNMFRAFIYVKKSDILPGNNATVVDKEQNVAPVEDSVRSEVIKALLACETTSELRTILPQLKASGKIADFNKLSKLHEPETYVIVVFDSLGNIKAVLSEGANRKNERTHVADALANYADHGAIGVKINITK